MGVYIPNEDIYVIGFSNCDCHSPTQITRDIARLALEKYKKWFILPYNWVNRNGSEVNQKHISVWKC